MKLTLKLFLILSLFCSVAFAEGEMTSGRTCPQGQQTCLVQEPAEPETTEADTILIFIHKYLISIFG